MAEIATTCPYCGCGCGLYLHTEGARVTGVAPSRSHPVSQGRLCLKGWHAHELMHNPARLTEPLVRRNGTLERASWEEAVAAVAAGLQGVPPAARGVLGSARATNEDNYVLARFARWTLGTGNLDCSARLQNLTELPAGELASLDASDLVVLVGADPNEEQPAVSARLYRARQRGAKLIAISARRHELARVADVFLPLRPGAEAHLLGALLGALLAKTGAAGAATLRSSLANATPEAAAVPAGDLTRAAALYAGAKQVTLVVSPALAAQPGAGTATSALADLVALGEAGALPPATLLPLLSRNNLRGCLDMGISPLFLPGRRPLSDAPDFAQAWGGTVCGERGLEAWAMLEGVQALYVMGDDVLRTAVDRPAAEAALGKLSFLVVQDLFSSQMCEYAHVVLPAAAFGEREGTFTNLEGRVQRVRQAVSPPGSAREDWRIVSDVSRALGKLMPYETPEAVFAEMAGLVPDYAGLTREALEQPGGRRIGGAKAPAELQPVSLNGAPSTDEAHPFLLLADPTLGPWDEETTIASTLTVAVEFTVTSKDYPGGMLALHPEDAKRLGLRAGRNAQVTSARGQCVLRVQVSDETAEGVALVPYWQATRLGVFEIVSGSEDGKPALAATAVGIAAA